MNSGKPTKSSSRNGISPFHDDLSREVYCVLGIPVDCIELEDVVKSIERAALDGQPFLISTPNLNFLVNSRTDQEFRESLLLSELCPPDGMPIIWIARLMGLPITRRTAGSDIFDGLRARHASERSLKIFLFGATEHIAAAAAKRLTSIRGHLKCVGWICPGFGSVDELSQDHFVDQINSSDANFLVCALGAKKGQSWLLRNHSRLRIPVRSHLGATINFEAGAIRRAPLALQKIGLEWLWRIKEEPSLFGRYWHDGWVFVRILLTELLPLIVAQRWRRTHQSHNRHDFVTIAVENGAVVKVRISGNATARQVPDAIVQFREALAHQKPLEVDLSQTCVIDARFFGLLLMLIKQLKGRGNTVKFSGLSHGLERQFRLNGLRYLLSTGKKQHVHAVR